MPDSTDAAPLLQRGDVVEEIARRCRRVGPHRIFERPERIRSEALLDGEFRQHDRRRRERLGQARRRGRTVGAQRAEVGRAGRQRVDDTIDLGEAVGEKLRVGGKLLGTLRRRVGALLQPVHPGGQVRQSVVQLRERRQRAGDVLLGELLRHVGGKADRDGLGHHPADVPVLGAGLHRERRHRGVVGRDAGDRLGEIRGDGDDGLERSVGQTRRRRVRIGEGPRDVVVGGDEVLREELAGGHGRVAVLDRHVEVHDRRGHRVAARPRRQREDDEHGGHYGEGDHEDHRPASAADGRRGGQRPEPGHAGTSAADAATVTIVRSVTGLGASDARTSVAR